MKIMNDKKADIVMSLVAYGANRSEVVDFLIPLFRNEGEIYLKKQAITIIKWSAYFQVRQFNTLRRLFTI